jgi:Arabidopsis protein of unknown function
MAPGIARSISLPLSLSHKKATYHMRSVSLPCRSHPLIFSLEEQIQAVRSWASKPERSSVWIEAGLTHIELLQLALEDFLQLSQTQETIFQATSLNQLLDELLQLVDFYSSFLSNIETLKQCNSEVQSALRRQDGLQMAASLRSHRHVEKQIVQLVSGLRGMTKCKHLTLSSDAKELETAGILVDAIHATAFASMAVFMGVGALSAAAMKSLKALKKRSTDTQNDIEALEKFEEQEERIRNIEFSSERVYRSLLNSRISLLNISTSSL